jgi:hypothetical protein
MRPRASILALLGCLGVVLLAPSGSLATLTEVGILPAASTSPGSTTSEETSTTGTKTATSTPSCPGNPCLAVTRTTGFQVKVGSTRNLVTAPRAGTLVAWTVTLGKPNATQVKYFNSNEGGAASAAIAVLAPQRKPNLTYKLLAQGPVVPLEKYFGKSAQFPLESTIPVKKGDIIALAVPTWAPALVLGYANTTSWRASRARTQCSSTSVQSVQSVGASIQYYCLYRQARLDYSATLISTP